MIMGQSALPVTSSTTSAASSRLPGTWQDPPMIEEKDIYQAQSCVRLHSS
jgi:hypothetical protein